jgi:hypothetical protein
LRHGIFARDVTIFFAFFAPFVIKLPVANPFWLRLRRARLFAFKFSFISVLGGKKIPSVSLGT